MVLFCCAIDPTACLVLSVDTSLNQQTVFHYMTEVDKQVLCHKNGRFINNKGNLGHIGVRNCEEQN